MGTFPSPFQGICLTFQVQLYRQANKHKPEKVKRIYIYIYIHVYGKGQGKLFLEHIDDIMDITYT